MIRILNMGLRGPFSTAKNTARVITKVSTPSAKAPVWTSTFSDGPPSICLYPTGISSIAVRAPPTAPAACISFHSSIFFRVYNYCFVIISEEIEEVEREIIYYDLSREAEGHGEEAVFAETGSIEGGDAGGIEASTTQGLTKGCKGEE